MPTFAELEGLTDLVMTLSAQAEEASHLGRVADAVALFDRAIAAHVAVAGVMPHGVVGRLAALYRRCRQHDEEVELLHRFRSSHASNDMDARYSARLSKAMALAERTRRRETIALQSLRPFVRAGRPTARDDAPEQERSSMAGET